MTGRPGRCSKFNATCQLLKVSGRMHHTVLKNKLDLKNRRRYFALLWVTPLSNHWCLMYFHTCLHNRLDNILTRCCQTGEVCPRWAGLYKKHPLKKVHDWIFANIQYDTIFQLILADVDPCSYFFSPPNCRHQVSHVVEKTYYANSYCDGLLAYADIKYSASQKCT